MKRLTRVLPILVLNICVGSPLHADQDAGSIGGRLNILRYEHCLQVQVYLVNKTEHEIQIVTGAGGVPNMVTPKFVSASERITVSRWNAAQRPDKKPEIMKLSPKEERLYDVYTLPQPTGETIEGTIQFEGNLDEGYVVEFSRHQVPRRTGVKQK